MARKELSAIVKEHLTDLINSEFFPGDKIPNEEVLCERFQVSRTTLREAIKDLSSRNILEVRRGDGTYVCENPGFVNDPLGWRFIDRERFAKDMHDLGLLLDQGYVRIAAQKAKAEKLRKLQEAQDRFMEQVEIYERGGDVTLKELFSLDVDVHRAIMLCCNNTLFERLFGGTYESILATVEAERFAAAIPSCVKWHQIIIDCIVAHEGDQGAKAMADHLEEIAKAYFPDVRIE